MIPPTCRELADIDDSEEELFEEVYNHSDNSWRHGTYETTVFKRLADETYWQASYSLSTDRETNELRDGTASICRVFPKQVTKTIYVTKDPSCSAPGGSSPTA